MNCSHCGALVNENDLFCKTCKNPVGKNIKYDIILPIATNNSKVVNLISFITKKDKRSVRDSLKKPKFKIASSISLSDSVKIERMFFNIGYRVDLVKLKESSVSSSIDTEMVKSAEQSTEEIKSSDSSKVVGKVVSKPRKFSKTFMVLLILSLMFMASFFIFKPQSIGSNIEQFYNNNTDPKKIINGENRLYRKPNGSKSFYDKKFNKHLNNSFEKSGSSLKNDSEKSNSKFSSTNSNEVSQNNINSSNGEEVSPNGKNSFNGVNNSNRYENNNMENIGLDPNILDRYKKEKEKGGKSFDFLNLLRSYLKNIDSLVVLERVGNNLSISSDSGKYKDIVITTSVLVAMFFDKDDKQFDINFSLGKEEYNIESLNCINAKSKYKPGSRGFELTILNDLD
ncbi:MAG: hypothetical protein CR982_07620 [Candidatus Cloacimonadota bacterium]|nr:MAG: hypothetical protein CR982_07620 [Candidatus Cloacimonadota bacterium]PIE78277.1 MAG: hypothetical protein CSA15_08920 [Candidatus Delongbacteria bacterium]